MANNVEPAQTTINKMRTIYLNPTNANTKDTQKSAKDQPPPPNQQLHPHKILCSMSSRLRLDNIDMAMPRDCRVYETHDELYAAMLRCSDIDSRSYLLSDSAHVVDVRRLVDLVSLCAPYRRCLAIYTVAKQQAIPPEHIPIGQVPRELQLVIVVILIEMPCEPLRGYTAEDYGTLFNFLTSDQRLWVAEKARRFGDRHSQLTTYMILCPDWHAKPTTTCRPVPPLNFIIPPHGACDVCGKQAESTCSGCSLAWYCGPSCQRWAWDRQTHLQLQDRSPPYVLGEHARECDGLGGMHVNAYRSPAVVLNLMQLVVAALSEEVMQRLVRSMITERADFNASTQETTAKMPSLGDCFVEFGRHFGDRVRKQRIIATALMRHPTFDIFTSGVADIGKTDMPYQGPAEFRPVIAELVLQPRTRQLPDEFRMWVVLHYLHGDTVEKELEHHIVDRFFVDEGMRRTCVDEVLRTRGDAEYYRVARLNAVHQCVESAHMRHQRHRRPILLVMVKPFDHLADLIDGYLWAPEPSVVLDELAVFRYTSLDILMYMTPHTQSFFKSTLAFELDQTRHRPTPPTTDWSAIYRLLGRIELACHDPIYAMDEQLPLAYHYAKLHAIRSIGSAGFQQLQAWCRASYPPVPIDAWEQLIPDNLRRNTDVVLAHRQWLRTRILHLDLTVRQLREIETAGAGRIVPMSSSLSRTLLEIEPAGDWRVSSFCDVNSEFDEPGFWLRRVIDLIDESVAALGPIEAAIDRMAHPRTC